MLKFSRLVLSLNCGILSQSARRFPQTNSFLTHTTITFSPFSTNNKNNDNDNKKEKSEDELKAQAEREKKEKEEKEEEERRREELEEKMMFLEYRKRKFHNKRKSEALEHFLSTPLERQRQVFDHVDVTKLPPPKPGRPKREIAPILKPFPFDPNKKYDDVTLLRIFHKQLEFLDKVLYYHPRLVESVERNYALSEKLFEDQLKKVQATNPEMAAEVLAERNADKILHQETKQQVEGLEEVIRIRKEREEEQQRQRLEEEEAARKKQQVAEEEERFKQQVLAKKQLEDKDAEFKIVAEEEAKKEWEEETKGYAGFGYNQETISVFNWLALLLGSAGFLAVLNYYYEKTKIWEEPHVSQYLTVKNLHIVYMPFVYTYNWINSLYYDELKPSIGNQWKDVKKVGGSAVTVFEFLMAPINYLLGVLAKFFDYEPAAPFVRDPMDASVTVIIDTRDLIYTFHTIRGPKIMARKGMEDIVRSVPDAEFFLWFNDLAQFSEENINRLNPSGRIRSLFGEHISTRQGYVIRDLGKVGRPLDRLIVFTSYPEEYTHEENLFILPRWEGEQSQVWNQTLANLVYDVSYDSRDVRDIISKLRYEKSDGSWESLWKNLEKEASRSLHLVTETETVLEEPKEQAMVLAAERKNPLRRIESEFFI